MAVSDHSPVDAAEVRRAALIAAVIGVAVGLAVLVTLRSVWLAAGGA